jgi:hypothetical protein
MVGEQRSVSHSSLLSRPFISKSTKQYYGEERSPVMASASKHGISKQVKMQKKKKNVKYSGMLKRFNSLDENVPPGFTPVQKLLSRVVLPLESSHQHSSWYNKTKSNTYEHAEEKQATSECVKEKHVPLHKQSLSTLIRALLIKQDEIDPNLRNVSTHTKNQIFIV